MSGRKTIAGHSRGGLEGIDSIMNFDEKAGILASEGRALSAGRRKPRSGLNEQAQRRLGLHLRALYESVVQQPVPDRFNDLIARLEETEGETREA